MATQPATPATSLDFAGEWVLEAPSSLFNAGEAGIAVNGDGRWSFLRTGSAGQLVRSVGWGDEGLVAQDGESYMFHVDGEGDIWATVSRTGDELVLDNGPLRAAYTRRAAAGEARREVSNGQPRGVFPATTNEAYVKAVAGLWLAPPGASEPDFELRPDGRWSKVQRAADGAYVRARGWDQEGDWSTGEIGYPGYPRYSLGRSYDGRGHGGSSIVTLSASGDTLRVNAFDGHPIDFRAAPKGTVVKDGPAPAGVNGLYRPASEQEFAQAVTGMWRQVGSLSFFGTADTGIEIDADGQWFKLDGAGARMTGALDYGRWEIEDTSAMNGPGAFFLKFVNAYGTYSGDHPAFSADRRTMRLQNYLTAQFVDYVRQ